MNFLFSSMAVYTETTCVSKYHICIYFYKIETFNDKMVMEVGCIVESVSCLISLDLYGFVIHFDTLQRNFFLPSLGVKVGVK